MLMQQQPPQSRFTIFMDKAGWTIVTGVTVFAITTFFLGKFHIIDFSWLMLILGVSLVAVMAFLVWYFLRATRKYKEDIEELKQKNYAFEDQTTKRVNQELDRLNNLFIKLDQELETKQRERFEEMKKEYTEAIGEAKKEMTSSLQYHQTLFNQWVEAHANGHRWEQKSYRDELKALKDELTGTEPSDTNNQFWVGNQIP